uniref:Uncharacterized protein n=1 Tax=Oryza barthii TaxID=65489 RepID=A0A0D3FPU7_9ORYZ
MAASLRAGGEASNCRLPKPILSTAHSYWTWGSRSACPSTHGSQNVAVEMEEEEGQMEEHVVQELGEERVEENFEGITEFNPDYIGCV